MHVLIVGADGAIGGAVQTALRSRGHEVTGTTRRPANVRPPESVFLDLAADDLEQLPAADMTVICAAMARFEECRNQPLRAYRVNVETPAAISERQLSGGGRVLLLSTSAVFDCLMPFRKSDDVLSPRTAYGRLKAEAETRLLNMGKGAAVLRLTKVIHPKHGILAGWISALAAGQAVKAFLDHRFCPLPFGTSLIALARRSPAPGPGGLRPSEASPS
jgi:dTDP-4-dehydrorhamnose reductase